MKIPVVCQYESTGTVYPDVWVQAVCSDRPQPVHWPIRYLHSGARKQAKGNHSERNIATDPNLNWWKPQLAVSPKWLKGDWTCPSYGTDFDEVRHSVWVSLAHRMRLILMRYVNQYGSHLPIVWLILMRSVTQYVCHLPIIWDWFWWIKFQIKFQIDAGGLWCRTVFLVLRTNCIP